MEACEMGGIRALDSSPALSNSMHFIVRHHNLSLAAAALRARLSDIFISFLSFHIYSVCFLCVLLFSSLSNCMFRITCSLITWFVTFLNTKQ